MYAELTLSLFINESVRPNLRQNFYRKVSKIEIFPDTIRCDLACLASKHAWRIIVIMLGNRS